MLAVVIPTRGQGDQVRRTLASLLSLDDQTFEVILVDQSDDDSTADAVASFLSDPRFRYLRSDTRGISAARNVGVEATRAPLIAHTDDDCEAKPAWPQSVIRAFAAHADADLLFGNVETGPHPPDSFIPSYYVARESVVRGLANKTDAEGIGACMAYRRPLWREIGGFDVALGVGGPFGAGEEVDFTIRALAAGKAVVETADVAVIHHGIRKWESGDDLFYRYLYGIGGAYAKALKQYGLSFLVVMLRFAGRWVFSRPVVEFGRTPGRWNRLRGFLSGFFAGCRTPVRSAFFDPPAPTLNPQRP